VVLVVEDNPDNLVTIRAVLHDRCWLVTAVDGEEGLRLARELLPSLILLDMHLPKLDGMSLLRELRNDTATRRIPVVALTASAMAGDRERFLRAGCNGYLAKPIDIDELTETVSRHVVLNRR
jgi:CheY-like chemotaxis protein